MIEKSGGGIMHWKTMIFAGQHMVEFGSANYSDNAFAPVTAYQNYISETVFYEDDPAIVQSFMREFDDLWVDTTNYVPDANVTTRVRTYPQYTISADMDFPPGQSFASRLIKLENAEKQKLDVGVRRIGAVWADNGWGAPGVNIYFGATGTHTVRVQQREDGAIVDEIVLSPDTYLSSSPGPRANDATILAADDGSSG